MNFFNTNDFALAKGTMDLGMLGTIQVNWEANELQTKPYSALSAVQYSWNGTSALQIIGYQTNVITAPHELMPFVALPRSKAVGAQPGVGGAIQGGELDLGINFGFGDAQQDHSAQFNWNIQAVRPFYVTLLNALFPPPQ